MTDRVGPKEAQIIEVLKQRITTPKNRVVEHMQLNRSIADMVAIGDCLHGYEIKSNHDNTQRLHTQIEDYSRVCRYVTLVVGPRLQAAAIEEVPEWWGVLIIENDLTLTEWRPAATNPLLEYRYLTELLWVTELVPLTSGLVPSSGKKFSSRKLTMQHLFMDSLDGDDVEIQVCETLRSRKFWKNEQGDHSLRRARQLRKMRKVCTAGCSIPRHGANCELNGDIKYPTTIKELRELGFERIDPQYMTIEPFEKSEIAVTIRMHSASKKTFVYAGSTNRFVFNTTSRMFQEIIRVIRHNKGKHRVRKSLAQFL